MARPVAVGPHILTRGFCTFANAFFACFTAVWMVNAGKALRKVSVVRSRYLQHYAHGSDGLEDGTLDRYHGKTRRLREVRGLQRGRTSTVSFVGFVTNVTVAIRTCER